MSLSVSSSYQKYKTLSYVRVNVRSWDSSKRCVFKQLGLNMTNQFWIARPLQTLHILSNSKCGDLFCHQLTCRLSYGWSTFRWLCECLCFFSVDEPIPLSPLQWRHNQITGVSIVCPVVCSGEHQRKPQSAALPTFVSGIHRWPVTGGFQLQRAGNAENASIWWFHHSSMWKQSIPLRYTSHCIHEMWWI